MIMVVAPKPRSNLAIMIIMVIMMILVIVVIVMKMI